MSTVAAMEAVPVSVLETVAGTEVVVSGRLDVHTVADVRLLLHDVVDRGAGDLMLHLGAAEVHDATGLGVIVGAHHRARRAGRRLVLVDVSPRLDRLLRVSRLHRVLARDEDRSRARSWVCRLSPPEDLPGGLAGATFGPWVSTARPGPTGSGTSPG